MTFEIIIVLLTLIAMLAALVMDKMHAGRIQQQRNDYGSHAVSGQ